MKKIEDLRDSLFATIDALKNPDKPMEIERARAIAEVAKVIVDSAKAEVDYLRVTGKKKGTGFIPVEEIANGHPRLATPEANGAGYVGKLMPGHG